MPRLFPPAAFRYGICGVTSVLAAGLHIILAPIIGSEPLFTLYYPVVMFCGWYGGLGPGLFATLLSFALAFYISEYYLATGSEITEADLIRFALFIVASVLISILNHIWHNTRRKALGAALEAERNADSVRQSEEKFRLAVEAVNGVIYEWDAATGKVVRSSKVTEMLGYDPGEVRPESEWWKEQIHPDDRERVMETFERVIAEKGLRAEFEYRIKGKDGIYRHVLDRMHCTYDAEGNLRRVIGCTIDISERKRAEVDREQLLALEQEATASAEAARRQSAFLAEASVILTSSLDHGKTLERLAEIIVGTLSDACLIYLDGVKGEVVMTHYDSTKSDLVRHIAEIWKPDPENDTNLISRAMRSGSSQLIADFSEVDIERVIRDSELRAAIHELLPHSVIVVPLIARERLLGAMLLIITDSGRRYGSADLAIAEDLARRAALAIDNARLFEAERESRRLAEEAAERTLRIQDVTAALSGAITTPDISLVIIDRVVAALGARSGSLALLMENGEELELVRSSGYSEDVLRAWHHIPMSLAAPHTDAVKSGEAVWIESYDDLVERYPHLTGEVGVHDSEARVSIPLVIAGRVAGAIGLSFTEKRVFSHGDREYFQSFARQCSQALERAWLYEGEQRASAQARREGAAREQMQEALRENEAHLRRLIEANIIGVLTATFDGRITEANDAFLEMIGYTREDLLNGDISWERMTPPEYREKDRLVVEELRRSGACPPWEKEYIRKDGSRVAVLMGVVLLENVPETTICFAVDVTEQKRVERELEEAKESAEAASRAKDHFLAVLSHELRTPLTPVLAAIHALGELSGLEGDERMLIDIVRRNVELEARLIDDLLDLTRIERGKVQLNQEAADAHLLLRSAIEICREDITGKGLELEVDLAAPSHHVYADPARLQQVFWNLIKNAVKFTPSGGKVTVRTLIAGNGNLQVEVSDTGVGIEKDVLPKIFDAFEQGGRGVTRQFGGLGLGLTISRTVMQLHGGRLEARSEGRDKGATFVAEIGLIDPAVVSGPQRRRGEERTGERKGVRILLVDDHKDTNRVMQLFLNRQGYQVYAAHTMSSALALAAGEEFDLVISDIGLPDGSGLELMRRLRKERPVKGIALSGYGMEEDIQRSIEVGFAEHLTKPVSAQKLQEVIQRLVKV